MKSTFFARRALLILCLVFFFTPFALRGARMAVQGMANNVKDWLPSDFAETTELEWFGRHFMGEQFVVVTWPGCSTDDPRFHQLVDKLQREVIHRPAAALSLAGPSPADAGPEPADEAERKAFAELSEGDRAELDRLRAREIGDALGLSLAADEQRNWGDRDEKWLRGDDDSWYFITPEGELYRWLERGTLPGYLRRQFTRTVLRQRRVEGELVARLGEPSGTGQPNEFHADPQRLTARLFKSITTGPELLEQLSRPEGPLWPRGVDEQHAAEEAQAKAAERLAGTLFGPDGKQTCIVLTLSEPGKRDLRRVIGRPLMGQPRGRLLELATAQCGVPADDLKLGGPPVDNVAIDEEGQITLARLIGFSALIGIGLSLACFRSIKLTIMIFFVGGVSAIASLGIVWWSGGSVDAIVMSMPSLIYVLGLSGAVHIINYYRDEVLEHGVVGAPERAIAHAWKPCFLASFTTALGLLSLFTSNIVPIRKFGFYSAIGVMATLVLLFAYLPSALQVWPPKFAAARPGRAGEGFHDRLIRFWEPIGRWIVRRHAWVVFGCTLIFALFALGLPRIRTSVQLIKLFDEDAKIIRDYAWLEEHLGRLVPMELVVRVKPEVMRSTSGGSGDAAAGDAERRAADGVDPRFQLDFLQRMEIAARIQEVLESRFGDRGLDIVGRAMSLPTFAPDLPPAEFSTVRSPTRGVMARQLELHRDEFLTTDYLRIDREQPHAGSELWRISLRLAALVDVDYGQFVSELQRAVEPVMTAYRFRDEILQTIDRQRGGDGFANARVAFLGMADPAASAAAGDPPGAPGAAAAEPATPPRPGAELDQEIIFAETLRDLLTCANVHARRTSWHDPTTAEAPADFYTSDSWKQLLAKFDCVVLVQDHSDYDLDFIRQHAHSFVDARQYTFDPASPSALTAAERGDPIHVVYTGVVPIVYKAQRTLLSSLIDSIACAFVMIALVMMALLRSGPLRWTNLLNVRAGLVSMIPNVFPVVLIFGAMGYLEILVDIGTMMTASVALGVAVDDTIHFLTWFRQGMSAGLSRHDAIVEAYKRCAAAMTQTTLIGGLGLSVFALSTFTPTQCFGVMMLALLAAALVGDLVFLPALLAGPLGRFFHVPLAAHGSAISLAAKQVESGGGNVPGGTVQGFAAPHIGGAVNVREGRLLRSDRGHDAAPH